MKNVIVLGSTGSIGTQTLDVVRNNEDLHVVALAAGSNIELLEKQIKEFKPEIVCVYQKKKAAELRKRLGSSKVESSFFFRRQLSSKVRRPHLRWNWVLPCATVWGL